MSCEQANNLYIISGTSKGNLLDANSELYFLTRRASLTLGLPLLKQVVFDRPTEVGIYRDLIYRNLEVLQQLKEEGEIALTYNSYKSPHHNFIVTNEALDGLNETSMIMRARNVLPTEWPGNDHAISVLYLRDLVSYHKDDPFLEEYRYYQAHKDCFDYVLTDRVPLHSLSILPANETSLRLELIIKRHEKEVLDQRGREQFIWLSKDNRVLGSVTRKEAHAKGESILPIHPCVTAFITDDQGRMLIMKRSRFKKNALKLQAIPSGHINWKDYVEAGYDLEKAIRISLERETKEETGLGKAYFEHDLRRVMVVDDEGKEEDFYRVYSSSQREHFYLFHWVIPDRCKEDLVIGAEGQIAEWISVSEIREMIEKDPDQFRDAFAQMFLANYHWLVELERK